MDCKATIKLGEFSRGGLSRGRVTACDHDFAVVGSSTPCGIVNEDSGELYLNFGCSAKTSDFIIDTLRGWWRHQPLAEQQRIEKIQLKIDNGPESSGMRTWFLQGIVAFADEIGKAIQLVYFPPYHSKYNPIERCWGILELHWNGTLLKNVDIMVQWAKSMVWKGLHPIVDLSTAIYQKGLSLTKKTMKVVEKRLQRHPNLPKWDILIEPVTMS
jgi:hypothetical protein